jgi:hypothetical protein
MLEHSTNQKNACRADNQLSNLASHTTSFFGTVSLALDQPAAPLESDHRLCRYCKPLLDLLDVCL